MDKEDFSPSSDLCLLPGRPVQKILLTSNVRLFVRVLTYQTFSENCKDPNMIPESSNSTFKHSYEYFVVLNSTSSIKSKLETIALSAAALDSKLQQNSFMLVSTAQILVET